MEQIILFESRARGTTDRIIIEVPTKREFSPSGKIFGWRNGRHRIPFNTSRLTLTGPGHSLSVGPARQPIGFVMIHPVVQDVSSGHDGDDDPFLTGSTHGAESSIYASTTRIGIFRARRDPCLGGGNAVGVRGGGVRIHSYLRSVSA